MELSLIIAVFAVACLISGAITFVFEKGYRTHAISIVVPIVLFFVSALTIRDEFGFWTIILSLGLCSCLMGSVFGIFAATLLKKK